MDALAGEEHEVIEAAGREPAAPVEDRCRIGGIANGDHRAADHRRAAPFEHRGEQLDLAGLRHRDRSAGERLSVHARVIVIPNRGGPDEARPVSRRGAQ